MNWLRNSLIVGIFIVAYVLFLRWNAFQEAQEDIASPNIPSSTQGQIVDESVPAAITPTAPNTLDSDIPKIESTVKSAMPAAPTSAQIVKVETDLLNVEIDPMGGDIISVTLKNHLTEKDSVDEPLAILARTHAHTYLARSGMVGANGTDSATKGRGKYSVTNTSYQLGDAETINVDLVLQQDEATVTKRFEFTKNSYVINVIYLIENRASTPWQATLYGQIVRDGSTPSYGYFGMRPFLGAAVTKQDTNYDKISFGDIEDGKIEFSNQGGWIALIQHYFLSAWIPPINESNKYELRQLKDGNFRLQFITTPTVVQPNQRAQVNAQLYVGPKIIDKLNPVSPNLELTVDYGWLWFIAKPLFIAMNFIHDYVGNWGVAIIILTFLIKLLFLYPSALSYRSMAKMRKLQPKMADLKEQYGEDRPRMSQELMKLYKKEGVNPLGGCLPILLQMPVFISLYYVIMESVELRHQPFMLWIQDLSAMDPYFILPLLMGLTMWIQQQLNPTPPDPMQAKIMKMLPIAFTILFMWFPAGLVLYWVVNNTLSIIQQYLITKQIEKAG